MAEVVHLEERLGGDLPVARDDRATPGTPRAGSRPGTVRACRRRVRATSRSGGAARSRLTNTKPANVSQLACGRHRCCRVEVDEVAFVRDRHERAAVDLVGPRVVLAAQAARRAALVAHDGSAAVLARVVEAADLAVGAAHDQQRHAEVVEREVVAGVRDVLGPAGDDPRRRPQMLLLEVGGTARRCGVGSRSRGTPGTRPAGRCARTRSACRP